MTSTLTIRLPKEQRAALRRRATALRKSESDLVRDLIAKEASQVFDFESVRHMAGVVRRSARSRSPARWREHIREMNWRK